MTNAVEIKSVTPPWIGSLGQGETPALLGPFEPFVDEHVVARFLQITPRRVLEMARKKEIPSHPMWTYAQDVALPYFRDRCALQRTEETGTCYDDGGSSRNQGEKSTCLRGRYQRKSVLTA